MPVSRTGPILLILSALAWGIAFHGFSRRDVATPVVETERQQPTRWVARRPPSYSAGEGSSARFVHGTESSIRKAIAELAAPHVDRSSESLLIAISSRPDRLLIDSIVQACKRNVAVCMFVVDRVLKETDRADLEHAGVQFVARGAARLPAALVLLSDSGRVAIGSWDLPSGRPRGEGHMLVLTDPESVRPLRQWFAKSAAPTPYASETIASSAGDFEITFPRARRRLVAAIDAARQSVDLAQSFPLDPIVLHALDRAAQRGVHVRRLTNGPSLGDDGLASSESLSTFTPASWTTCVVDGSRLWGVWQSAADSDRSPETLYVLSLADSAPLKEAEDHFDRQWHQANLRTAHRLENALR